MDSDPQAQEQHLAASVVLAGLSSSVGTGHNKHRRSDDEDDSPEAAAGGSMKKIRALEPPAAATAVVIQPPAANDDDSRGQLKPYPFFYYTDHSTEEDLDSLTPLTPPGRVPNFPAKMHAIMSRPDLADVICWMDHGRSWKVLKPREFEIRVIPTYFEHAKFSSFIRQANGWGFRRITTGRDRNSYYHPLFLRSLPHLCKNMKRPGVSKKLAADPEHEPDLYKISELHPVPNKPVDESILLQCTLQGGPKARMPIYSGILSRSTATVMETPSVCGVAMSSAPSKLTPSDHEKLASFQAAIGDFSAKTAPPPAAATNETVSDDSKQPSAPVPKPASAPTPSVPFMMPPFMMPPAVSAFSPTMAFPNMAHGSSANPTLSALVAANQMAFGNPAANGAAASVPPNPFAAFQANAAASQFAAGFAAAAAFNQQQMQTMLQTMQQQQQGGTSSNSQQS